MNYYQASAGPRVSRPSLRGRIEADVCVIGAGVCGLSAALCLAERGYSVVVLDSAEVGAGASGRSGGQFIFGYACAMSQLEALVGMDAAKGLWQLSLDALALTRARISNHGIDCDWVPGHAHVAVKTRQIKELRRWQESLHARYDYPLTFWDAATLAGEIASPRYCAGLYDPMSFHAHPLKYTQGLARAAEQAGVRIFEHSPCTRIDDNPAIAHGLHGAVQARALLLCANAQIGALAPPLQSRIMPVGTYIAATEPLSEQRAQALIRHNIAVADLNFVLDYFRLSADRRLLFGGQVSYSGLEPLRLKASLRRRMLAVFPQLSEVALPYCWGGMVDISPHRAPDLGRLGANTYYAQGFSGHGMALAGLAGQVMAEAVAGETERLDLFGTIPRRAFPGGRVLRTPLLVLAMLVYRLRDRL